LWAGAKESLDYFALSRRYQGARIPGLALLVLRPIERIQSAVQQPSRLPGERPGSISGMGTGLRRCGGIFDVSICPQHLMKSADQFYVGYQIDNNIILLYNYGHEDLITHRAKAICGVSADRKNTGCVAVPSFAEPAQAQDFRQSPTSSADNFLEKQEK